MEKKFNHIILISLDTLRADCIGASPIAYNFLKKYKAKIKLKTSSLDEILKSGVYFNNCISAASSTSVSHASYFTGLWPKNHGLFEYFNRKIGKPTIFQYAKKAGYKTFFQTDFPIILGSYLGFDKGIDHYYVENENKALGEILKNKDKKTFSFFHFGGIHYPYGFHVYKFGKKDYVNKIKSLEKKYKIKKDEEPSDMHDESFRNNFDKSLLSRYKSIVKRMYDGRLYDELFSLYLEGINYFFKNRFDSFLKKVKKFTDENDALLIIFADHGEAWDENTHGHYNSLSDEVLRVPLIFYAKDIFPGKVEGLIRTIDVAPTVASHLSGLSSKIKFDGEKLNIFNLKKIKKRKYAVAQFWYHGNKEKFIKHQQKIFANKKLIKPMSTYLSSEMAYDGINKLIKFYNSTGRLLDEQLLVRKKEILVPSINKGSRVRLEKFLKEYNNLKVKKTRKVKDVTLEIKNYLNNLGYKI